jgi:short-subunit dehydrogenase
MCRRGRGGLIVMSSLAGQQGSPGLSAYAATKAFGAILAEGLWGEAREHGVDVVTCVPGAVSTPSLLNNSSHRFHLDSVAVTDGETVDRGQQVGTVGATGRATGPHLHFGAQIGASRIDPAMLLSLDVED